MNVVIDIGNTLTKVASFDEDQLIDVYRLNDDEILSCIQKINPQSGIFSFVREIPEIQSGIKKMGKFLFFSTDLGMPIELNYQSTETLGQDRIANAVGANFLYPRQNNLIIDIGTCITYDVVDENAVYHGGAISPGFDMRLKSLHYYTSKLPLVEMSLSKPPKIGKTTEGSIKSGVVNGVLAEIKQIIDDYRDHFENMNVILTGGHSSFVKSIVEFEKNGIFALENLTLIGLNEISRNNV